MSVALAQRMPRTVVLVIAVAAAWTTIAALVNDPLHAANVDADADRKPIAATDLKSGIELASPELRQQQEDLILNPGMLAVDQGARAFAQAPGNGQPTCKSCHIGESMRGLAAQLPKVDRDGTQLHNLHTLVNRCRTQRQHLAPLDYESPALLALVSYLANQSHGIATKASVDGPARRFFDHGRALYGQRMGQMNLACTHCHDQNWGRRLLAEPISQGHGNGYPIYRLEWQAMGSLHRRFRSCLFGVRAQLQPQGSDDFMALELYLAWRGEGLKIEAPGVRR
jgi:L-cysteine S-thiosulfotransferase